MHLTNYNSNWKKLLGFRNIIDIEIKDIGNKLKKQNKTKT